MPKRVDENQKVIVKAFRDLGVTVQILSDVGKGCPDLLVGANGLNFLVEVKNPNKPLSGRRLTEHEQEFFDSWRGQVCVLMTVNEVIDFVNEIKHFRLHID